MTEHSSFAAYRRAGSLYFFAGIVPPATHLDRDIEEQSNAVYSTAAEILATDGMTVRDVVNVTAYLADGTDFAGYDATWRTIFPTDPPARTTVVASLLVPRARVEISIVACTPD